LKKIEAYTIIELIIALMITSVIIIIAISLYFQLVHTNRSIEKNYNRNTELLQLKSVLSTDFERYENVEYSVNELYFQGRNNRCYYEFTDFGILRKYQEMVDTFKFEVIDLEYVLKNANSNKITKFTFNIKFYKNILPLTFYKDYNNDNNINNILFENEP